MNKIIEASKKLETRKRVESEDKIKDIENKLNDAIQDIQDIQNNYKLLNDKLDFLIKDCKKNIEDTKIESLISCLKYELPPEIKIKVEKYNKRMEFESKNLEVYKGKIIAYREINGIGDYEILAHAKTYEELDLKIIQLLEKDKISKKEKIFYCSYQYEI